MPTASKKVIQGWAMYDWANSVYNLVITSTIFPAYYDSIAGNEVRILGRTFIPSALYNYALAVAFVIVALLSPLLSSIADYRGNKKSFLFGFCTLGSIACSLLYFFDTGHLEFGLICMMTACVGFWGSLVFYNSFLPEIAAPEDRDRVSARGFIMGYIGSVILQLVCFFLVLMPDTLGITVSKASQICFLLVGLWWWGFGQLALSRLPASRPAETAQQSGSLTGGYRELRKVWQQLTHLPVLKHFLLSFFCYNMGVQTVMLAATLYGKSELEIPTTNLIVAILIIQIIAIPGAYLISRLSARIGNFAALIVCVVFWIGLCIGGYLLPARNIGAFYTLALSVGLVMGGIQSLSRSTYSKLMPATRDTTSFFSFFDVTEKLAIVFGMFSFAWLTEFTGSQRSSVLALIAFFLFGLILLIYTSRLARRKPH